MVKCRFLFFTISFLMLYACAERTEKDILKEKFDKRDLIVSHLNEVSGKYLQIEWDTVYVKIDSENSSLLWFCGEGKSKKYYNYKVHVGALCNYDMENDSIEYESLYAYNDEFGDVINIHGNDELLKEIVTPNEFKKKIWLRNEAVKERKDKVRLAYLNKTRVHFGMTRGDFEKSDIEHRINFVDGLIGYNAYYKTKFNFSKGILVGLNIHGNDINYINLMNNAHLSSDKTYNGRIRFLSHEKIYTCSLYNSKIYELRDLSTHEESITIDVYWNNSSLKFEIKAKQFYAASQRVL